MTAHPSLPTSAPTKTPLLIGGAVLLIGLLTTLLFWRARSEVNKVALVEAPKGVTTIETRAARYRPSRLYVGTVAPWLEARVGPQFTAAYVDTVLVRPGDVVKKGQVLATLDCKSASAQSQALRLQARALSATQEAIAKEAGRLSGLLEGGYVSPNEVERRTADSATKQAELLAANARSARASLEVDDCILRAPFDGEVADRLLDPGGFARPGSPILILVDREKVRVLIDVPESDFTVVAEGTPVHLRLFALGAELDGKIARRAPAADAATRTVHAELDLTASPQRVPVGTTAELTIGVGEAVAATELPLRAAAVRGESATVFTVSDGIARKLKVAVLGESGGSLLVATTLPPGTRIVAEGRALVRDGDRVTDSLEPWTPLAPQAGQTPAGQTAKGQTPAGQTPKEGQP